jgi:hypothetical protein
VYSVACSHENEKASRALIQIAAMIRDTSIDSANRIAGEAKVAFAQDPRSKQ